MTCLGVVSFLLNFSIIALFIYYRRRLLRNNDNKLLFSMIVADMLVGIFGILYGELIRNGRPAIVYKTTAVIPLFSNMFASIASITAITVNRLIAVNKPLQYRLIMTSKVVVISIVVIWTIPLIVFTSQLTLYLTSTPKKELMVRSCMTFAFFAIGSIALGIPNYIMYMAVKRQIRLIKAQTGLALQLQSLADGMATSSQVDDTATKCDHMVIVNIDDAKENPAAHGCERTNWDDAPYGRNRKDNGVLVQEANGCANGGRDFARECKQKGDNPQKIAHGVCAIYDNDKTVSRDRFTGELARRRGPSFDQDERKRPASNLSDRKQGAEHVINHGGIEENGKEIGTVEAVVYENLGTRNSFKEEATSGRWTAAIERLNRIEVSGGKEAKEEVWKKSDKHKEKQVENCCILTHARVATILDNGKQDRHRECSPEMEKELRKTGGNSSEINAKQLNGELQKKGEKELKWRHESMESERNRKLRLAENVTTVVGRMKFRRRKASQAGKDNIHATHMCILFVIAFIICWLPLSVYRLRYVIGMEPIVWLRRFGLFLAAANSLVNPCIYLLKQKMLRKQMKMALCRTREHAQWTSC